MSTDLSTSCKLNCHLTYSDHWRPIWFWSTSLQSNGKSFGTSFFSVLGLGFVSRQSFSAWQSFTHWAAPDGFVPLNHTHLKHSKTFHIKVCLLGDFTFKHSEEKCEHFPSTLSGALHGCVLHTLAFYRFPPALVAWTCKVCSSLMILSDSLFGTNQTVKNDKVLRSLHVTSRGHVTQALHRHKCIHVVLFTSVLSVLW